MFLRIAIFLISVTRSPIGPICQVRKIDIFETVNLDILQIHRKSKKNNQQQTAQ